MSETELEPGTRCPTCDRRIPKPRQTSSPDVKAVRVPLPIERAIALEEALEALQAYIGADPKSYPRGTVLEMLVIMGGQERERLKDWFEGRDE